MLVKAHQAEIYRYLKFLGADHSLAEDLVQDTFLTTFQTAPPPSLSHVGRRGAWLRGIARHLLLRYWERRARDPIRPDSAALELAESVWADTFPGGDDGSLMLDALRTCLEQTPPRGRELLDLRYARRQSRRQMADALALTEDGVKSALQRLRARLWECVQTRLRQEGV